MTLTLVSSAPAFVAREIFAFVPGAHVEDTIWDGTDAPAWAESIITGPQTDAFAMALANLGNFRFERWSPRPAYADPTYALAAARITRDEGGSAPAAAWAR